MTVLQRCRIVHDPEDHINGPFRVHVDSWLYGVLDHDRRDLLLYHYDPNSDHPEPHLHVGSTLLDTDGHELGKMFSKLHIAIGPIPLQRVIRMLIEEFDVQPLHDNWQAALEVAAG